MAIPTPLILDDAGLKIGSGPLTTDLKHLECAASHIELSPDTSVTTVDTMCGSVDFPGTTKWSLVATLIQSFDALATEEVLSAAVSGGVPVPFEIVGYKSNPISATNPKWSGMVQPQPYAPINGDAGDVSNVELEWAVTTGPVKSITGTFTAVAGTSDYDAMTVAELQDLAGERGLPTSGTKAELIERLTGA
jgi:hypothetical protein